MRSTKDLVDIVQDVRSRSKQGSRLRTNNRVKILPSNSSKQDMERVKTVSRAASLLSRESENQNYETVPTQQDVPYVPATHKQQMLKSNSSMNQTIDRSNGGVDLSTLKKLRKLEVLAATDKETIEV